MTTDDQVPDPADGPARSFAERIPNAYVLIFGLIVIIAVLTWIVPPGQFARTTDPETGRTVVVPSSFRQIVPGEPLPEGYTLVPARQGVWAVLSAPIDGFVQGALIIAFILIIGGVFKVLDASGAVRAGIQRLTALLKGREILIIPIMMTAFSLGGATIGMSEETILFVMMFVPLALALGYDRITGVAMVFVGAGAGFAGAFLNPFTVQVAQGIAELPPGSGMPYRVVVWVIVTAAAIGVVMRHARRVHREPQLSPTWRRDEEDRRAAAARAETLAGGAAATTLSIAQATILLLLLVVIVLIGVGSQLWGWYIGEIAALLFGFAMVVAAIARLGADRFVSAFTTGAGELAGVALVVALARGALLVAERGGIIDPTLHAISSAVGRFPPAVGAQVMFLVQSAINVIVPSGAGQAALTMPIMAPLADLIGITRQTAVLAFQFGDGFSNMIIPTSPVLLGVLGAAGIPWAVWARWILTLQLLFLVLGLILLVPPVFFEWGPH